VGEFLLGASMATKKKLTLESLIGKTVVIKSKYRRKDDPEYEGPFECLGIDSAAGFIGLRFEGKEFWWTLSDMEGLKEVVPTDV
jgi:hypothetical protein